MFYMHRLSLIMALACVHGAFGKQFLWEDMFDPLSMDDLKHNVEYKVGVSPKSNLSETATSFSIEVAVPGLTKEDIKIDVAHPESNEPVVTISADVAKEEVRTDEGAKSRSRSVSQQSFSLRFRLSQPVIVEGVKADLKDGVLTVTLPKATPIKKHSHQIQIQ